MEAIMIIMPVILVITSEHIGHQVVTSKIVGRDLLKDPGLHRSIFGDNFSTMVSGLIGSVPTTTYGENIGVMAVTKVYSVQVIAGAAVISIICSFIGKLSTLIQTIPGPVIGGISFLLYGMIGTSGLRILVDSKVDYGKKQKPGPDCRDLCNRPLRDQGEFRQCAAHRYGPCMCCRHDFKPDLLSL